MRALSRRSTWRWLAAIALVAGGAARAAAATTTETVALRYEAPSGCPDRSAYVARVALHGGDVALIDGDAATARVFVVRIDGHDGQFVGAVTILVGPDQTRRAVEAADCGELVDALALVTVLAVDPGPGGEAGVIAAPPPRRRQLAVGAGAAGALGVTPDAMPSLPLFVELDDRDRGRLRLGAGWGRRSAAVGGASATFDWVRVQLDGCPRVRALERGPIGAAACAGLQVGALRARGAQIAAAQATTRPWIAPAVGARARWRPGPRWFAELDVTAAFPLVRDRFFFAPDTTVHQMPRIVGEAAIVVGVSIP